MSLQEKQQYLRIQIVEKGANAEQFYEFWQTFGIQLSNATIQDVVSIVTEFYKRNQNQQQNDDQFGQYVDPQNNHDSHFYQDINWDFLADKNHPKTNNNNHKQTKQVKQVKNSVQNNIVQITKEVKVKDKYKSTKQKITRKQQNNDDLLISTQQPNLNNVTFQDVIKDSQSHKKKCLKLQPNILQHHINVQIFISKFKQVTEQSSGIINKLWKGTYMLFTIKTIGRNKQKTIGISWEVQRQPTDFQWLRNTLIKMYPGLVVPPLPSAIKSQSQLNGYQRKLQSFLLDCYNCPQLRNSKYFQIFLSYSSQKDFQTFKKSCQNTSKPKDVSHVLNMEGEISLLYSQKIEGYAQGLQNFINKTSQHLKNVKGIIKQIDQGYSQISTKYKELSQVFVTMSQQSCEFSDQQCYPRLTQTYRQISQLVSQHSYFCMLQKQFLQTFMFSHFTYQRDRVDNMQTLITKRKTFGNQYSKPKHQVQKPVESSSGSSVFGKIAGFFGQKTQSIEIPSSDTNILREQVGYYNSQLMRQSIRCVQGMITSHVKHFSLYGHSRIDNVQSMQKLWSKLMVDLSKLNVS